MKAKMIASIVSVLILAFAYSAIAGTLIYQYDELNRLTQVQYPHGTVIDYSYDVVGNRMSLVTTFPPPQDDHGNDPSSATPISLNTDVSGDIEYGGDVDFFKFYATAGEEYVLETTLVSLPDSYIYLYDTNGITILAADDDSGQGYASKITWACTSSGYYYVKVKAYNTFQTGTYTLRATGPGPAQVPVMTLPGFAITLVLLFGIGTIAIKRRNGLVPPPGSC